MSDRQCGDEGDEARRVAESMEQRALESEAVQRDEADREHAGEDHARRRHRPEWQEASLGGEPPCHERAEQTEERLRQVQDLRALVHEHQAEGEDAVHEAAAETDDDVAEEIGDHATLAPARNTDRSRSVRSSKPPDGPS